MKALLICLALAFPIDAACSDNIQFAIITGVDSVQRVRTGSSLFPWVRESPDEVIVSLSCGFAQATYWRATTPGIARLDDDADPRSWKVFVQLGHYCKLSEYVLDGWHLVAYRNWRGKDYLIDFAEIRVGEDDRLYVDNSMFIEHTGLEAVANLAAQASDSAGCTESGPECPDRRIYLDSIPMQANKSPERTRDR